MATRREFQSFLSFAEVWFCVRDLVGLSFRLGLAELILLLIWHFSFFSKRSGALNGLGLIEVRIVRGQDDSESRSFGTWPLFNSFAIWADMASSC